MQTELEITERQDLFLGHYRQQEALLVGREPDWLTAARQEAIQSFLDAGFPTTQDEDWRYTNVSPITQTAFQRAPQDASILAGAEQARAAKWAAKWASNGDVPVAARLVFVNGQFSPALSDLGALTPEVKIGSLRSALAGHAPDWLRVYLGRAADSRRQAFTALNSALWLDGACVLAPHGLALKDPIHLVHLSAANGAPAASHPRVLIVAEREAQVTVVESFLGAGDGICFSNAVTEIVAAESAVVDHYRVVRENSRSFHVGLVQVYEGHDAQVTAFSASLGGALVRNEIRAELDGEGADCAMNGLYLASGLEHVDNHTEIDHAKPHGSSRQLYHGILDGHSTAVFNGRVIVRPNAQKTDAIQKNRNLLLSADSTIDTKPQLEISANDVRCTHGATVGQLDAEALFFLRSRGLGREEATALLVQAFAAEVLDKVKLPGLRHWLDAALRRQFAAAGPPAAGNDAGMAQE